jgi:hypothetical protein
MRAHFLSTIHPLRNNNGGWVPTSDMNFGGLEAVTPGRIRAIYEQLREAGLIVFKPLPGGSDGGFVELSKITGHGCDVVEGVRPSTLALEFHSRVQPMSPLIAADARAPI